MVKAVDVHAQTRSPTGQPGHRSRGPFNSTATRRTFAGSVELGLQTHRPEPRQWQSATSPEVRRILAVFLAGCMRLAALKELFLTICYRPVSSRQEEHHH